MGLRTWPSPMTIEENLSDMEMHAKEFVDRVSFTYSILDGETVVGCVYIYPTTGDHNAVVRSWVTESRSDLDRVVWETLSVWLAAEWPFDSFSYARRA